MALLFNRGKMTTATTGTGAATTLGSAVGSFQTFAAAGVTDGVTVPYGLEQGDTDWEVGTGVYTAAGTVFTRTPTESSNAGGRVNLDGTAEVFITMTKAAYDDLLTTNLNDITNVIYGGNSLGIGLSALANDDLSSNNNTAFGQLAGQYITTSENNVAIGKYALRSDATNKLTGNGANVAIGQSCMLDAQTSRHNVAIGDQALKDGTGSQENVAIGRNALTVFAGNFPNTAVGAFAGDSVSSGYWNTLIGYKAGDLMTTGANCLTLGNSAQSTSVTASNEVTLGNSSITTLRCQQTTITALSDERDKKNITDISLGLEYLEKVRPVEFDWAMREKSEWNGKHVAGFIAQEMMAVEDEYDAAFLGSVLRNNPDKLEVGPAALLPIMVKAIQELSARVKELEAAQ
jgi:hypothetical protein